MIDIDDLTERRWQVWVGQDDGDPDGAYNFVMKSQFPFPNSYCDFDTKIAEDGTKSFVMEGVVGYTKAKVVIGQEIMEDMIEQWNEWKEDDQREIHQKHLTNLDVVGHNGCKVSTGVPK